MTRDEKPRRWAPFCSHAWQEVGRDVVPAKGSIKFGGGAMPDFMDDLVYGYTTISLRCEHCGKVGTRKVRGVFKDAA